MRKCSQQNFACRCGSAAWLIAVLLLFGVFWPAQGFAASVLHKGQKVRLSRRARILPQPRKGTKKLYPKGTVVKVIRLRGKRALVRTPDHRRGWFPKKILVPVVEISAQDAAAAPSPPPPPPPPPTTTPHRELASAVAESSASTDAASSSVRHQASMNQALMSAEAENAKKSDKLRVAVYALKMHDLSPRLGRIVGQTLTAELRKLKGLQVIGVDEVMAMLDHEANKQLLGCEQDSCVAEIAGALGVDEIVVGDLSRIADKSAIALRRLNLKQAKALHSYDLRMNPNDGEEFLSVLGDAVETLYPGVKLLPGQKHGVDERTIAALHPAPLPTWVFWTSAGTASALLLAGGAASLGSYFAYENYNTLAQSSLDEPLYAHDLNKLGQAVSAWDMGRWSLLAGAGTLIVVTGFEAILTDWQGLAEVFAEDENVEKPAL